jgi:DNA mismatch endonuclease (patch repair protein)
MSDNLSSSDRRKTMRAVKGKGGGLERRLFAMLAGMGLHGWTKNAPDVLGKPDVVFREEKVAIFVDGCFWHDCPVCQRKLPKTNREYWEQKINRNAERDKRYTEQLHSEGWTVIRIWGHEIRDKLMRVQVRKHIREAILPQEESSD